MTRLIGRIGFVALALAGGVGAAAAQAPAPASPIDRLETGLWELRNASAAEPGKRICVSDIRQLLQPLHPMPLCRQFVAGSSPDQVTVTYECAARGQGHTALRVETPRLVQIDSQGVSEGRPFATRLEGRYVGQCGTAGPGLSRR